MHVFEGNNHAVVCFLNVFALAAWSLSLESTFWCFMMESFSLFLLLHLELNFYRYILRGNGLRSKMGFDYYRRTVKNQLQNFTTFILRGQRCCVSWTSVNGFVISCLLLLYWISWYFVAILQGDADGYDLVVVDAMHKANYASRICHSCKPNCEAKWVFPAFYLLFLINVQRCNALSLQSGKLCQL